MSIDLTAVPRTKAVEMDSLSTDLYALANSASARR